MNRSTNQVDVAIIGGGVTGTAVLYLLARYTNIPRIALFEKYPRLAQVASNSRSNSQTLHFGDIETNYSLNKAVAVKAGAEMVLRYVEAMGNKGNIMICDQGKMVLGVGSGEVELLEKRYEQFRVIFPKLKKFYRDEIAAIEPKVVEGRAVSEKIVALYSEEACAIDFGKLSESFAEQAQKIGASRVSVSLGTPVTSIGELNGNYVLHTSREEYKAAVLVVAAGSHSLLFAKQLGYGKNYSVLPVAGTFYYAPEVLRGKVYTVQVEKLPFAAVHGDPDIAVPGKTRFGPTARVLPWLEHKNYRTFWDFIRSFSWSAGSLLTIWKIISDSVIFKFIAINFLYDWPIIGKRLFLKNVKKIIPTMMNRDIQFASGVGGIRAQLIDTKNKELLLGEVKVLGKNIIFNMTPSPGASTCLKNADDDMHTIIKFFKEGYHIREDEFRADLHRRSVSLFEPHTSLAKQAIHP